MDWFMFVCVYMCIYMRVCVCVCVCVSVGVLVSQGSYVVIGNIFKKILDF